jgi:hypothetical protein
VALRISSAGVAARRSLKVIDRLAWHEISLPAGLRGPAPGGTVELGTAAEHLPVIGRRRAGMQVQRHCQFFQRCPHLVIAGLVQVVTLQVVVDQGPAKAELADAATQFGSRSGRVLHG